MGRRGAAWCLLLAGLGACDRVFEIRHVDETANLPDATPIDAPGCTSQLAPDADEDHDGVLNATDPCPRIANEDSHDEDRDAIPDVCDLCPTLAGSASGADADCDGLGAACDPDDSIPHDRQFNGFASSLGLTLEAGMTVKNDQLVATLPGSGDYGRMRVMALVAPSASYETRFTINGFDVSAYQQVFLQLNNAGTVYSAGLVATISKAELQILDVNTKVGSVAVSTPGAGAQVRLRMIVAGAHVTVDMSGDITGQLQADLASAPVGPLEYDIDVYQDTNPPPLTVQFDYLSRIAPR